MNSINVILTTTCRPSLTRMLSSLVNQLQQQDYLTIIVDPQDENSTPNKWVMVYMLLEHDFKCTVTTIYNIGRLGYWGHGSRNKYQNLLPGDYLMNGDDDDRYVDGSFDVIREKIFEHGPGKLFLFKHEDTGKFAWSDTNSVREGNIGTSCGVIPNTHRLPHWGLRYGGDADFYVVLAKIFPIVWCDHVIYKVKDTL